MQEIQDELISAAGALKVYCTDALKPALDTECKTKQ